jgi:putative membrane protein
MNLNRKQMMTTVAAWNPFKSEERENPWEALAAGLVGGLAGSLAMHAFHNAVHRTSVKVVERVDGALDESASREPVRGGSRRAFEDSFASGENDERRSTTATAVATKVARRLAVQEHKRPEQVADWALGTALGAGYGLACEYWPEVSLGAGLPFGAGVMLLTDEIAKPAMRITDPPNRRSPVSHAEAFASFLVYGATCELVRRGVRRLFRIWI